MKETIISEELLPANFKYPKEFLWLLERKVGELTPWILLESEFIIKRYNSLKERYPARHLFPFAYRQDCDELACWDLNDSLKIKVIEDYSRANPAEDVVYNNFWDWFRTAIEDMIEFSKNDISYE